MIPSMTEMEHTGQPNEGSELYPPQSSYQWISVEDCGQSQQDKMQQLVDETAPGYNAKEILFIDGRPEEQRIVGLAYDVTMTSLMQTRKDFPVVQTPTSNATHSAIGTTNLRYQGADGALNYAFLLIQHKDATDTQYRRARTMYLEGVNGILEEIKRNPIPYPTK